MNTPQNTERRRFHRILFDAPVTIFQDGVPLDALLIDVSLKGALIQLLSPLDQALRGDITLEIRLDSNNSRIRMNGEIVHQEIARIGFQFRNIDMDSITHLRRLVELNLGDPALLERELHALG